MLKPVKLEGRWGFAWGYQSNEGQLVVPPYFAEAREFSEGMAAVKFVCSWGYINEQGKVAIAPMFDDADSFSEGIAKVKVGSKDGFINQRGEFHAVTRVLITDSKTDTTLYSEPYWEDDMDIMAFPD